MIQFGTSVIPGTHQSPIFTAPELHAVRNHFAGVRYESEILLGTGGRPVVIPIMLHSQLQTAIALEGLLKTLNTMVGMHELLEILEGPYGGVPMEFPNCTFEGFTKDGSDDAGPLADMVGLLDGVTPSWWIKGMLMFRQLSTEEL